MVFSAIRAVVMFSVAASALFSGAASAAIVQYNNAAQPTFVGMLAAGYYQESTWPNGLQANPYVRSGGTPSFTLSATAPDGIFNSGNALATNNPTDLMTVALTTGGPTAFGAKVFASDFNGVPIAGSVTVTVSTNQATASVVITSTAATTLATAEFIGFAATGAGEVITSVTFLATQTQPPPFTWSSVSQTYVGRVAPLVNGACGTANGAATGVAPSANLCAAGTASAVTTAASQFTWACNGANTGSNASCAAPRTYTVTPSVSGGNGTATIPASGVVAYNATGTVTITPNAGFVTATPVGGSCGGTLAGSTYTTNAVIADCTVIASFVAVVNGACGTANGVATGVAPSANLCAAGTASTVTTAAGQFTWACNGANTGSNASCAAPRTYTVTPSVVGGNGSVSAASNVVYSTVGTVTITASAGYATITPVGGTCGGTLSGTTYTTSAVLANCTVVASFLQIPLAPTPLASPVAGGAVSCAGPATFGGTSSCTATASPRYRLTGISGCGGVASTTSPYTTGAITTACAVTAVFELVPEIAVPTLSPALLALLSLLALIVAGFTLRRPSR